MGGITYLGTGPVGSWGVVADGDIDRALAVAWAGDLVGARRALQAAVDTRPSPAALDALGQVRYLLGEYSEALDDRERSFAGFRRAGDHQRALRTAASIAYIYGAVFGNPAVCAGWLGRARRLSETAGPCPERGWAELVMALFEANGAERERRVAAAKALAREFGDVDQELAALAFDGWLRVERGRVDSGMAELDEAAAAATSGEVRDLDAVSDIYCKMMLACEVASDVRRAEQWIAVTESFSRRTRCLSAAVLFCRSAYCGILLAAGRWPEADSELRRATDITAADWRALRAAALIRLASLRTAQGRLDESVQLLAGYEQDPSASLVVARLCLARGDVDECSVVLRRFLDSGPYEVSKAAALALLAHAKLATGRHDHAGALAEQLRALAAGTDAVVVAATSNWTDGLVAMATGDNHVAAAELRRAVERFTDAGLPIEQASARLDLARAVVASDAGAAVAQARTALATFERLSAGNLADQVAHFLRGLGVRSRTAPRSRGEVTRREREVLDLMIEGLSNESIAERLYISKRTVEHHVSNILAKLGVRNRSSAVAYGIRHRLPGSARD